MNKRILAIFALLICAFLVFASCGKEETKQTQENKVESSSLPQGNGGGNDSTTSTNGGNTDVSGDTDVSGGTDGSSDTDVSGGTDGSSDTDESSGTDNSGDVGGTDPHVHSYDTPGEAESPTCTEDGYVFMECSCGEKKKEIFPAKGHTEYDVPGYGATCTVDGLTDGKKCTVCLIFTVEQEAIPALGHTEENVPGYGATCTVDGLTDGKKCTVCLIFTVEQEVIPALGHTEENVPGYGATCTSDGLTDGKKCTVCLEFTEPQTVVPSPGHTEEKIEGKEPSCGETGLTDGWKCSICQEIIVPQTTIPASDHVYKNDVCTGCGKNKVVSQGLDFLLSADGTYYILRGMGTCQDTEIIIPSVHEGTPVMAIAQGAFRRKKTIVSVDIPDSIITIAENAFSDCTALKTVIIGNGVETIDSNAFYSCTALESVKIGKNLSTLELNNWAFWGCTSLKNITVHQENTSFKVVDGVLFTFDGKTIIKYLATNENEEYNVPNGVTTIRGFAFESNTYIKNVVVPNSVTRIGASAFKNCTSLTSITLPFVGVTCNDQYEYYFGNIFSGSISNANASIQASLKTVIITGEYDIKGSAFANCKNIESIVINAKTIGEMAFYSCSALKTVTLKGELTKIGGGAFGNCSALETIEIPSTVMEMDSYTFDGCSSLQYYEEDGAYYLGGESNKKLILVRVLDKEITSFEFKQGTRFIGANAFSSCTSLTSIALTDEIKLIGSSAFSGCSSLSSVNFGSGLEKIGMFAFQDCISLKDITLPSSVKFVGGYAFAGCNGIVSMTVPFVGESKETNTFIGYLFGAYRENENATYVPASLETVIVNGDIARSAFYECTSIKKVIVNNATAIGEGAFDNCTSLTSVELCEGITSIGDYAFRGTGLIEVILPSTLNSIGNYAFAFCEALTSINIPRSVTTMGMYVFRNCSKLTVSCEASSKPSGWDSTWKDGVSSVKWGQ